MYLYVGTLDRSYNKFLSSLEYIKGVENMTKANEKEHAEFLKYKQHFINKVLNNDENSLFMLLNKMKDRKQNTESW